MGLIGRGVVGWVVAAAMLAGCRGSTPGGTATTSIDDPTIEPSDSVTDTVDVTHTGDTSLTDTGERSALCVYDDEREGTDRIAQGSTCFEDNDTEPSCAEDEPSGEDLTFLWRAPYEATWVIDGRRASSNTIFEVRTECPDPELLTCVSNFSSAANIVEHPLAEGEGVLITIDTESDCVDEYEVLVYDAAAPDCVEQAPNDTAKTATVLPEGIADIHVGPEDIDWYEITLPAISSGDVYARFDGSLADVDIRLYDQDLKFIDGSLSSTSSSEHIGPFPNASFWDTTFYLKVETFGDGVNCIPVELELEI